MKKQDCIPHLRQWQVEWFQWCLQPTLDDLQMTMLAWSDRDQILGIQEQQVPSTRHSTTVMHMHSTNELKLQWFTWMEWLRFHSANCPALSVVPNNAGCVGDHLTSLMYSYVGCWRVSNGLLEVLKSHSFTVQSTDAVSNRSFIARWVDGWNCIDVTTPKWALYFYSNNTYTPHIQQQTVNQTDIFIDI